jgi:DNA (cytosine-5)-methyltransferase 1
VPPLLAAAVGSQLRGEVAVDLFAGCGGLSKGFEMAGWDVIAGLDIDAHAMATWGANHRGSAIVADITEQGTVERLKTFVGDSVGGGSLDAVIGGPPCQGFSLAGWRDSADPRNQLWVHYVAIVRALAPRYFVLENVPGMVSTGKASAGVVHRMREAFGGIGYQLGIQLLRAEEYGVPQLRRRVFVIGSRTGEIPTFPKPQVTSFFTVRDALSNLPRLEPGGGDEVSDEVAPATEYQAWLQNRLDRQGLLEGRLTRSQMELQLNDL